MFATAMSNLRIRFQEKINPIPTETGCLKWIGGKMGMGYGMIWNDGQMRYAHRVAWFLEKGAWPQKHIDHLCDNRWCVNVEHLEDVTCGENTRRGTALENAVKAKKAITHCPQGHPYSGKNLIIRKQGWRRCKKCSQVEALAYYYRKKAAVV